MQNMKKIIEKKSKKKERFYHEKMSIHNVKNKKGKSQKKKCF